MRCNYCNARLANHDLWCVACGKQTPVIGSELSALRSLTDTWNKYKAYRTKNIPAVALSIFLGVIPLLISIWLFNTMLFTEAETNLSMISVMLIKALVYSTFAGISLILFAASVKEDDYSLSKGEFRTAMKGFPKLFLVSLTSAFFYMLIYLICFGLPGFGSDPILRLVWIVLVSYWPAILLPVPILVFRYGFGVLKAYSKSYRHFHDLRWNIFLMAFILMGLNALAAILFVIGLVITIPFSIFAIRDYTAKLVQYELLEYRR